MAQQDDIIIIKTEESIETSILDYFFNIALVTEIDTTDLVTGVTFNASGMDTYNSLEQVAEHFVVTSKIYKIARSIFDQKSNNGINQSNVKRLVIIKKEDGDKTFEECLNRVGYNNSYFIILNPTQDSDLESVNNWVSSKRKLFLAQTNTADVISDVSTDIASTLKNKKATRTALYYHNVDDEYLAGAMASILASYPVGGKSASYKEPTGITPDKLGTKETYLSNKNVNYFVYYIGGAGEYSTRKLTSDNGVTSSGDEIEKIIAVDRIVLSLQSALMDALEQDIPYDDNGGTIVYGKVVKVLTQLKNEGILAQDSIDDETGEVDKSFTIYVPTRATLKRQYPDQFKEKAFIIKVTANLAGTGKKVYLTFAY